MDKTWSKCWLWPIRIMLELEMWMHLKRKQPVWINGNKNETGAHALHRLNIVFTQFRKIQSSGKILFQISCQNFLSYDSIQIGSSGSKERRRTRPKYVNVLNIFHRTRAHTARDSCDLEIILQSETQKKCFNVYFTTTFWNS